MLLPAAIALAASLNAGQPAVTVGNAPADRPVMRLATANPYARALAFEARRRAFWRSRGGPESRRYAQHRVLACAMGDKSNCW